MNLFLFACVCSVAVVLLGTRSKQFSILSCFVSLVLVCGAFATISPSMPRDQQDLADGSEFRSLGSLKAMVFGFRFPATRTVIFGEEGARWAGYGAVAGQAGAGEAALVRVAGIPTGTSMILDRHIEVASVFNDGRLFSAAARNEQDVQLGYQRHEVPEGAIFCLAGKEKHHCDDAAVAWELGSDGLLSVTTRVRGKATSASACPLPSKRKQDSDRIFPLENYGRPGCAGGPLDSLNFRDGEHPFVFLQAAADNRFAIASMPVPNALGERLLVLRNGEPIAAQAHTALALSDGATVQLKILRVDISAPEQAPAGTAVMLRPAGVEVGVSRLYALREFSLSNDDAKDMHLVRLLTPSTSTVPSLDACTSPLTFAIHGHADLVADPGTAGEFKVEQLASMGAINGQGTVVRVERGTNSEQGGDWLFSNGCSGFGRAMFSLAGPNGSIAAFRGGDALALGDGNEAGQVLLTIAEIGVPIWSIILLCGAAGLLRALIRRRAQLSMATLFPVWALILLALVDGLLVLRLVAMFQESGYGNADKHRVAQTLIWFAVLPIALELFVCARAMRAWRQFWAVSILSRLALRLKRIAQRWTGLAVERWMYTLCLAVPALHLLATGLGVREKAQMMSVTIVLVPLYVLCFAWLFFRARRMRSEPGYWPATATLLWVVCMGIGALAFINANDSGAIFVHFVGPALLFGFEALRAGRADAAANQSRRWGMSSLFIPLTLAVPVATYSLLLLSVGLSVREFWGDAWTLMTPGHAVAWLAAFTLVGWLGFRARSARQQMWLWPAVATLTILLAGVAGSVGKAVNVCQGGPEALVACYDAKRMNANALRVAQLVMPDRVLESVSREGLGMGEVFAELGYLTKTWAGPDGKGFMTLYPRKALNAYDNAPALHLIAPFGTLTAYFLMLVLAAIALYAARAQARRPDSFGALLAAVATVMFCCSSMYMLAVNLQWVLFTGKNVYLASALSWSDLLEGTFVVAIALAAFPFEGRTAGFQRGKA